MSTNAAKLARCKPRQVRKFVIECIKAGLVPFIQSSPGIGKSSITRSIAKDFRLKLIDHRLSTSESTDLTGLPDLNRQRGKAAYLPFDIFPLANDPLPLDDEGKEMEGWLLFFDEFNAAMKQVQAASYKVVLDKMIGQHHLNKNVAMVLAGNLMTDRAIVNSLSTAMQSRLIHIEMECDFQQWLEDVAIPEHYDSRIIGFLSQFPSKLMDFQPTHQDRTFCCPRTWEFTNKLISEPVVNEDEKNPIIIGRNQKTVDDESGILLAGTITAGTAIEFVKFTQVYTRMISVSDITADPHNTPLPREIDLKWAVTTHMTEKITYKNFDALATYADRFDLTFRILFYRMVLTRKKDEFRTHPDFGRHVSKIMQYLT